MQGYHGRRLEIDLTERSWHQQEIAEDILTNYLGGKGLAAHLLLEEAPAGVDALAPESPLIVAIGPATGSGLAPAGRHALFAKSPLTGVFGESYSGGHVAPKIDATGYDAVTIQGAADHPVYLEVSEGAVTFHDATEFWRLDAYDAEKALEEAVAAPGAKAIVIGPAGENLVPFAVVANDRGHQCGRTGIGAVMGSKKLKGIVFHGSAERPLFDPEGVREFNRALRDRGRDDAGVKAYRELGTPMVVAMTNTAGAFPSYYWSKGTVDFWEQISAETLVERFQPRPRACHGCFIACRKGSKVREGRHAGLELEGPEYETIYAFGGLCAIDDLAEIAHLNDLCDRLGMDTITAGNVAGFAIEASRRGALDVELDYGDVDGIAELLRQLAKQEGPGELLGQGVRHASQELGLEDLAVHVKGMEPAGYEPRALKGMGLAYAISDRGACHLRATVYKAELSGWVEPDAAEGKGELVMDFEDRHTIFDTLVFCRFYRDLIGWEELPVVVEKLTGLEMNKEQLQAVSARIADTIREYNLREGMTPADDTLPSRLLKESLQPGGQSLTRRELDTMLEEYYELRGW